MRKLSPTRISKMLEIDTVWEFIEKGNPIKITLRIMGAEIFPLIEVGTIFFIPYEIYSTKNFTLNNYGSMTCKHMSEKWFPNCESYKRRKDLEK